MLKSFWKGLGSRARAGLVAGVAAIAVLTGLVAYWALRPQWEVLFADLTAQDAAAMTAELERLKIPFSLGSGAGEGTTILVERSEVHPTRLKLMGRDLPLRGAVGFELFNNSDFGMTEFAQRVNYQRALQGELTRTIASLSEVRDVRVHLAIPEPGLFRQSQSRVKASITLSLRQGQALRAEQVAGIQRLVAAAVPGIAAEDVTIVDQWGVALTRPPGDSPGDAGGSRLDLKREAESYLSRKAMDVLDRALGAGQALASVDVTLNLDRVQTTVESVVGAPGKQGHATGVVVRERESLREVGGALTVRSAGDSSGGLGGSSQREVEYAVGRRVEQVISQPGTIRRIQVVAVVRRLLSDEQREQVSRVVAASVGAAPERGDTVVVQSMEAITATAGEPAGKAPPEERTASAKASSGAHAGARKEPAVAGAALWPWALGAVASMALASLLLLGVRKDAGLRAARPGLTGQQREAALEQLRGWLREGEEIRSPGEPT